MNFQKAEFISSYGLAKQIPKSGLIEIAFAGRSNVGKSSALNKLFSRKALARVSSIPGKTATINFYKVDELHFVDLPGYGFAKAAKTEIRRWSSLIDGYFAQERRLILVVQLVDMRHKPSELDLRMIDFLSHHAIPFVVILTKCDKLNKTQTAERLEHINEELGVMDDIAVIPFSSETGEGVDTLRAVIDEAVEVENERAKKLLLQEIAMDAAMAEVAEKEQGGEDAENNVFD